MKIGTVDYDRRRCYRKALRVTRKVYGAVCRSFPIRPRRRAVSLHRSGCTHIACGECVALRAKPHNSLHSVCELCREREQQQQPNSSGKRFGQQERRCCQCTECAHAVCVLSFEFCARKMQRAAVKTKAMAFLYSNGIRLNSHQDQPSQTLTGTLN